jgi:ferredoxin-type protein NapG
MNPDAAAVGRRGALLSLLRFSRAAAAGGLLVALHRILKFDSGAPHTVAPRIDEKDEYALRPPGALAEPDFLARCIHCYLCQDVCPAGCIQMHGDSDSSGHTPYITPRLKGCTLCLKCGAVCPTGALRPLTEKREARMGVAAVDTNLCVAHLRTGVCGACYTVCPLRGRAITQGLFNAPTVQPDACTGCGLCEEVCIVPYRAIRVYPDAASARTAAGSIS